MSARRRLISRCLVVAIISLSLLTLGALAITASGGQAPVPAAPVVEAAPPQSDASAAIAPAGVITQLAMLLDGSTSVTAAEFVTATRGISAAIWSPSFPKDGSIELTVIQFGSGSSKFPIFTVPGDAKLTLTPGANHGSAPRVGCTIPTR